MDLLTELEGRSGENLCSAVLRLLLTRSASLRDSFVDLVSRENKIAPLAHGSHFGSTLEEPTDGDLGAGRLDLYIEIDDAVIGIENKIHAHFQEDQPHKYLDHLEQKAQALGRIRGRERLISLVVVLAPEGRRAEIGKRIAGEDRLLMLAWEDVLERFSQVGDTLDAETRVLLDALARYMGQQIGLFVDWHRWWPHLLRRFEPRGTALQREFIAKVWQFFPNGGIRLGASNTWCGYGFGSQTYSELGWYGFVSTDEIVEGAEHAAEFVIFVPLLAQRNERVQMDEHAFRKIRLRDRFTQGREGDSWAANLDDDHSWLDPAMWRERLEPLVAAYRRIYPAEG